MLGLLSVLVAPVTGSCGLFGADDCTCTLEFRQYVVRVVDSAETPVVGTFDVQGILSLTDTAPGQCGATGTSRPPCRI